MKCATAAVIVTAVEIKALVLKTNATRLQSEAAGPDAFAFISKLTA
jgi:hypothetical protein